MLIFNNWIHLFVCCARLRIIFPYSPQLKEYIRSSSHALPLITFIPIKLPRTESGKGRAEGSYILACVRGFIGWSRRMVHPPTPIPSSLFLPAFCESLHLSPYSSFSLSLSFSMADPLHDTNSNAWKHGCDYLATLHYESLNPVNAHHCSYAYFRSFPLR